MAKSREPVNPFYVLLVVLGVVFSITAFAYTAMAYRAISRATSPAAAQEVEQHALTDFLDRHGVALLSWELGLLAVASFAAMGLDRFRDTHGTARPPKTPAEKSDTEPGESMR